MALVAICTVVDVPVDFRVLEACCVIVAVTAGALKYRIVIGVGMASSADSIRVAVTGGKPRMVERRPSPRRGRMASSTGRRESCRRVIWVRCVLIVRLMASVTIGRQSRVVVVSVT
jgi:hypothetical protein